jgi:CheY-like chemotaxis protein
MTLDLSLLNDLGDLISSSLALLVKERLGLKMVDKDSVQSVLIVNHDPAVLVLLASMLERNGFRALFARNSQEAEEITARQYVPVDLVLCDVSVDGESGHMIVSRLRELRPGIRELFVSTAEDRGAIRIRVVRHTGEGEYSPVGDLNLVDHVRGSLQALMRAGA